MNDPFITGINTQRKSMDWMNLLIKNMTNIYTPGYRERKANFGTFLQGATFDDVRLKAWQGKAYPGTAPENLYIEGKGFFVVKKPNGKILYTRLGEFAFKGDGTYKTKDGFNVQGYIVNDKGEIMSGSSPQVSSPHAKAESQGGPDFSAMTDIKLWRDPSNGKYLGKYDEFKIKKDGIIYGQAEKGKVSVPLYKIGHIKFPNAAQVTEVQDGYYDESPESGKPVLGNAIIRSGVIEMANVHFRQNISHLAEVKMQIEMTNKIIQTSKQLLEESMKLMQ